MSTYEKLLNNQGYVAEYPNGDMSSFLFFGDENNFEPWYAEYTDGANVVLDAGWFTSIGDCILFLEETAEIFDAYNKNCWEPQ